MAANAKEPMARHQGAYLLGEASLKLASAARICLYLERWLVPGSEPARSLESLTVPSIGHWCELLHRINRELGNLQGAQGVVLARVSPDLSRERTDWAGVRRLVTEAAVRKIIKEPVAEQALSGGLLGFYRFLCTYRNAVVGHGGWRRDEFYEAMAALLLEALSEVLGDPCYLDGLQFFLGPADGDGAAGAGEDSWVRLTGLASETAASDERGGEAKQLYLDGAGQRINLHPLLVHEVGGLGQLQIGFLNHAASRGRPGGGASPGRLRRVDHLDYVSGEVLSREETLQAVRSLLCRLRGSDVDEEEVQRTAERTLSEGGDEGAIPMATGRDGSRVVVGDFELLGELGRGGMGVVYRARQLSTGRVVALKQLSASLAQNPVLLERFQREIEALASCDHPNIARVYTSGAEGGAPYFAMEYVPGVDLERLYKTLAPLRKLPGALTERHLRAAVASAVTGAADPDCQVAEVGGARRGRRRLGLGLALAELFSGAAAGLDHLHQQGVVHRDVKPGNIMITADASRLVLMDLGLAQLDRATQDLTDHSGRPPGTPRYMAPERLRPGAPADHRVDIYGLGATLYELLLGRRLHDGETADVLTEQILNQQPARPRSVTPGVSRDLETVLLVSLAAEADHRYGSAAEQAADMRAVARYRPIEASTPGVPRRLWLWAQRNRLAAVVSVVALALLLGGGLYWWQQVRVKVSYYNRLMDHGGVLKGVGRVSSPAGRRATWQVFSKGGRVLRSVRLNARGMPRNDPAGDCFIEYVYADSGELMERIFRRQDGRIRQRFRFTWKGQTMQAAIFDRNDLPTSLDGSDVSMLRTEYDARGHWKRRFFFNERGAPRQNKDSAYGFAYETDEQGQITRKAVLDSDGAPSHTRDGIAAVTSRYDRLGSLTARRFWGPDGKPALNKWGYATLLNSHDDRGRLTRSRYLGVDGKATLHRWGHAVRVRRYDREGNLAETSYEDLEGKPTNGRSGFASVRSTYNDRGDEVSASLFDARGEPSSSEKGFHLRRFVKDNKGREVRRAVFGLRGEAVLHRDGWSVVHTAFDARGNTRERRYLGQDNKPILIRKGYAVWRGRHDDRDNLVEESYLDRAGAPTGRGDGIARIRYKRNDHGRVILEQYFDARGDPMLNREGFAARRTEYNTRGKEVSRTLLGKKGELVLGSDGYAQRRQRHDGSGNMVFAEFLGVDGEPVMHRKGFASWRETYDAKGRKVSGSFFGLKGELVLNRLGVARWRFKYDARGNLLESIIHGADGQRANRNDGISRFQKIWDARGRQVGEAYFDAEDRPVFNDEGYASVTWSYTPYGNLAGAVYFGADKKPVVAKDGYAAWKGRYDRLRRRVEERYFGPDGELMLGRSGYASIKWSHDSRGNETGASYAGLKGEPISNKNGWASWRARYDERNNTVEMSFHGVDGGPVLTRGGVSVLRMKYDRRGDSVENEYLGLEGKPILHKLGYATMRFKRDSLGREVERSYHGVDGALRVAKVGYAIRRQRLDHRGNPIEQRTFDAGGRPLVAPFGYATLRMTRDAMGRVARWAYFDEAQRPAAAKWGAAIVSAQYDARGNKTVQTYRDAEGRPALSKLGYSTQVQRFDAHGRVTLASYLDAAGKPAVRAGGYHAKRSRYDQRGRLVEESVLGVDGELALYKQRYATMRQTHDQRGNVLTRSYFDRAGKPTADFGTVSTYRTQYDARDRRIATSFLGTDGAPTLDHRGVAQERRSYSSRGDWVQTRFFGLQGEPAASKNGDAVVERRHNRFGEVILKRHLGLKGELITETAIDPRRAQQVRRGLAILRGRSPALFHGCMGVVVSGVTRGRPGDKAGIRIGDLLLKFGRHKILRAWDFWAPERKPRRGKTEVLLLRDGENLTVKVGPGSLGLHLLR